MSDIDGQGEYEKEEEGSPHPGEPRHDVVVVTVREGVVRMVRSPASLHSSLD